MDAFLTITQGALVQGLFWGIMILGVYITYRILDIADLTVDGSFALGGSVCAILVSNGMNPFLALLIAFLAGSLAGFCTGFLHTFFEIPAILAGILTQISLWSINLKIMGKSNVPLLKAPSIDSLVSEGIGGVVTLSDNTVKIILGVIFVAVFVMFLYWFFGTEVGAAIRATGNNEDMVRALGVDTKKTKLLGLMLSNALVALSGALIAQSQKFGDISMGTGAIVIGLASIIIGSVLFAWVRSFGGKLVSAVIGCIIYFMIRAIALKLGLDPNDMKLISAIIVGLALCVPFSIEKMKARKMYTE